MSQTDGGNSVKRPQQPIFAIFEGGGAKGISHIGAVAAADRANMAFLGVAGASAGAMVAALVAAGYRAHNLLRPGSPGDNLLVRLGRTPIDLLGEGKWIELQHLQQRYARFARIAFYCGAPAAGLWGRRTARIVRAAFGQLGHFSTRPVSDFINEALRQRLKDLYDDRGELDREPPDRVTFADLDYREFPQDLRPLKIVATDIDARRSVLFDRDRTPRVVIGDAVAASIAIPGFFQPALIPSFTRDEDYRDVAGHRFADGGLVSNLPAHVFLEEKLTYERSNPEKGRVPIVAFTLVDPRSATDAPLATSAWDYLAATIRTAIFGSQITVRDLVPDLVVVPLESPLGLLQFDAKWEDIRAAYESGLACARKVIAESPALLSRVVRMELLRVLTEARTRIDAARLARGEQPVRLLRASILRPLGAHSLRVAFSANMEADADDRLTVERTALFENNAIGLAFQLRSTFAASTRHSPPQLDDGMTKYERALIRRDLAYQFCVPIFASASSLQEDPLMRPYALGVFVLDSNDDLDGLAKSQPGAELIDWLESQGVILSAALEERENV